MQLVTERAADPRGRGREISVMKHVTVYASERRSNALRKENLIYDNIDLALDTMSDVDWCRRPTPDPEAAASRPGLREVRPIETVVALGRAAHTILADYRKQTLVAGDDDDEIEEDVERLVWSCVNTSKVVALGRGAWRSVQMLPIMERRFYEVPPLRMLPARDPGLPGEIGAEVLVINHETDDFRARQVAEALGDGGYRVQRTGRGGDDEDNAHDGCWSTSAPIHVHVGCHDGRAEEVRLLDTWHSRRFAISLLPRRLAQNPPSNALMVEPEVNGFLCETPEKVLAACADIRADPVLRKKMLNAGAASVAPLAREWLAIAAELVS